MVTLQSKKEGSGMFTPESVNKRPSRYIWSFCLVSHDTHD